MQGFNFSPENETFTSLFFLQNFNLNTLNRCRKMEVSIHFLRKNQHMQIFSKVAPASVHANKNCRSESPSMQTQLDIVRWLREGDQETLSMLGMSLCTNHAIVNIVL